MAKLKFDNRFSLSLGNGVDANAPFPFGVSECITFTLSLMPIPVSEETLRDTAADAVWSAMIYPAEDDDLIEYNDPSQEYIFLRAQSVDNPIKVHILKWHVDHEDFLFAVVTEIDESDPLFRFSFSDSVKVNMVLRVRSANTYNSLLGEMDWRGMLIPDGEKIGNLTVSEVEIVE